MKVHEQSMTRLVLHGIPQFDKGLVLPFIVGGAFVTISIFIFPKVEGEHVAVRVLFALPFFIGIAIFIVMLVLLTFRERLELDKAAAAGNYRKWSVLFGSGKRFEFELAHIRGVSLTHRVESSPGTGHGSRSIDVWEAKLLITKPRRSLILAKENTTKGQHTISVAQNTADYLGVELLTSGDLGALRGLSSSLDETE
jgi:hypothetical protein